MWGQGRWIFLKPFQKHLCGHTLHLEERHTRLGTWCNSVQTGSWSCSCCLEFRRVQLWTQDPISPMPFWLAHKWSPFVPKLSRTHFCHLYPKKLIFSNLKCFSALSPFCIFSSEFWHLEFTMTWDTTFRMSVSSWAYKLMQLQTTSSQLLLHLGPILFPKNFIVSNHPPMLQQEKGHFK